MELPLLRPSRVMQIKLLLLLQTALLEKTRSHYEKRIKKKLGFRAIPSDLIGGAVLLVHDGLGGRGERRGGEGRAEGVRRNARERLGRSFI